jgi:hypothetical protein
MYFHFIRPQHGFMLRPILFFFLALLFAATGTSGAKADTVLFPPLGCSGDAQYITWVNGNATQTSCENGQQILNNAIPTCAAGQEVVFDGSRFVCQSRTEGLPTCGVNQFLSYNGSSYECRNTGVPTCGTNQVLTFNGTNYYCVNRTDSIPACGTNQFLTYNGSYQCATVNEPAIPNCPAGQVVTGNGSQLYCENAPGALPSCGGIPSYVVADQNNNIQCVPVCPSGLLHGSFPNPQEFRIWVPENGSYIGQTVGTTNEDDGSPTANVTCTWQGWSF